MYYQVDHRSPENNLCKSLKVELQETEQIMNEYNGLINSRSRRDVGETLERFRIAAQNAGLLIFAEIDHGRNAIDVGLALRQTVLLIFGNPKGGTPLMQLNQTSAIDLPFKILVWEDEHGVTWLSYNDPEWIAERHRLGPGAEQSVTAISEGMKKLVAAATN